MDSECWIFFSHTFSTQVAPLLCVPLITARHSRALSLPTEAFSAARRALCHLRSRMEEVCREEIDKISLTGIADDLLATEGSLQIM